MHPGGLSSRRLKLEFFGRGSTAIVGVITNNLFRKIKLVGYTPAVVGVITNNLYGKIKLVGWIDKNIFANLYKRGETYHAGINKQGKTSGAKANDMA